ncbi:MAG: site-specific integrase [Proteobacteria bacterium]|nr:site-specific integrase [Pseudomonadota bacterium]
MPTILLKLLDKLFVSGRLVHRLGTRSFVVLASYLVQRGSTLHFRLKVPGDVRPVLGCSEIKLSLKTGYRLPAKARAMLLAGVCLDAFDAVRAGSEVSPDWLRAELCRLSSNRVRGVPVAVGRVEVTSQESGPQRVDDGLPEVGDAVAKYLAESRAKWRTTTYDSFKPILEEFMELIGGQGVSVGQFSLDLMRGYKAAVIRLPKNMNKLRAYRSKSLNELLQMDIPEKDRMSFSTLNRRLVIVKGFFKWLKINYGIQGGFNELLTMDAPKKSFKSSREGFSDDDILALFGTKEYRQHSFDLPFKFWVPLIGLHQGMRLNEICQLHLVDIRTVDGFWCFDINDGTEDKRLKTSSSRRVIPIHPVLIEMGLLEHVEKLRCSGQQRLFPELRFGRHGYADATSKWFARYKLRCGLVSRSKVFHSFRNTVSTQLKAVGVSLGVAAQILGHALEKQSMTFDYYADGYPIEVLAKALEQMRWLLE